MTRSFTSLSIVSLGIRVGNIANPCVWLIPIANHLTLTFPRNILMSMNARQSAYTQWKLCSERPRSPLVLAKRGITLHPILNTTTSRTVFGTVSVKSLDNNDCAASIMESGATQNDSSKQTVSL